MGIQINGQTDIISSTDGSLTVSGADLNNPVNFNVSSNLGIGTTNPTVALQLSPTASISNVGTTITLPGTVGAALTVAQFLHINSNTSYLRIKATRNATGGDWTTVSTKIVQVTDFTEQSHIEFNPIGSSSGGAAGLAFGGTTGEWARFNISGNLGIGTTNPGARLQITPTSTSIAGLFSGTTSDDMVRITQLGSGNAFRVEDEANPDATPFVVTGIGSVGIGTTNPLARLQVGAATSQSVFVDTSGRLLVGTSSTSINSRLDQKIAVVSTGAGNYGGISLSSYNGTTPGNYPIVDLQRSRGTTDGSMTSVVSGDQLGAYTFRGSDGTNFVNAAIIFGEVDGAVGVNSMPGRIVFSTTAATASSPTERMRIRQDGSIEMGKADSGDKLAVLNASASNGVISAYATSGTYASTAIYVNANRAANTAYNFIRLFSGDFADVEFNLRGDGNAFADGTWTGGGADYAEYFEWVDGNTAEEDRRGISVVLDGDKIREATTGEEPIGVISGNPSVVGDGAWNKWSGKYLRDEFGTYIQENYEVEDEDGNTVVQQRRKLNPVYNPDQEYISREQRPEWDCVGLMGKLRIRKGQVTGARWIKMRDVSVNVEEWLVR